MLPNPSCSTCCAACSARVNSVVPANPLTALQEFLPAGTVAFTISSFDKLHCDHVHMADSWHVFPGWGRMNSLVDLQENSLIKALDYLIQHHFIASTCTVGRRSESSILFVRIYLIPYDLNQVQGKLRVREIPVVSEAQKFLRALLPRVNRSPADWEADCTVDSPSLWEHFMKPGNDDRTMAEIYSCLASPLSDIKVQKKGGDKFRHLMDDILENNDRPEGLTTILHRYQRRTIAAMIHKELSSSNIPDPLYIPITGIDGKVFYFQPASAEVLSERPLVSQARGGILCEELGTGKTVMTLALILSTIDQLSSPEESLLDCRPVMTPLAFKKFPFPNFATARQRFPRMEKRSRRSGKQKDAADTRIPSLTELLIHYLRTSPDGLNLRHHQERIEAIHLDTALENNVPFYHHYNVELPSGSRSRRKQADPRPRIVYLTSASLVIVPANLLNQWVNEINKHCDDTLRVYVVRDSKPLPPATKLASLYDIVLMTHIRFSTEASKNQLSALHTSKRCECPPYLYDPQRIPDCRCNNHPDVTPLLQIRWKRLVIDEGHVSASSTTNLSVFAQNLNVERRWIVTGTPTTNLMGLHFGEGSELQYPEMDEDELEAELSMTPESVALRLEDDSRATSMDIDDDDNLSTRIWSRADREDLRKLSRMMVHLGVPQFSAQSDAFDTYVTTSLLDRAGPRPGSIQVLTQVMETVMVRHRIEDVEKDVLLPILHHETVLLDLDPYGLKTYNVMQAVIAVNAVDSERVGQDYFFHPSNAGHLQQVIENISQSMFWHTDENLFNIEEIMHRSSKFLEKAATTVSEEDQVMLKQALHHVNTAGNNPVWRELLMHANVFHRVTGMPEDIYQAWSLLPPSISHTTDIHNPSRPYTLSPPERLTKLRDTLNRMPLSQTRRMIQIGHMVCEEERLRYTFNLSRLRVSKSMKKHGSKRVDKNVLVKELNMDTGLKSSEKMKEIHKELAAAQARMKAFENEHEQVKGRLYPHHRPPSASRLLASSPLAGVHIGNSTSSKLNYILNEVRQYAGKDKFLIFSKSPLTLAYLSEALELMQVKCLQFTSRVQLKAREQYVTTFETSETYRVFLMELKHGARGLNLIAASRVIFCEPVWQADVETQAIKRVHRIGQTRPVTVKTLAIRSTFEEVMVTRREALKSRAGTSGGGKLPNLLTDDVTMRDYIAHPTFLPDPGPPQVTLDIPFLGEHAAQMSAQREAASQAQQGQGQGQATTHNAHTPTPTHPPSPNATTAGTSSTQNDASPKLATFVLRVRSNPNNPNDARSRINMIATAGSRRDDDHEAPPPRKKRKVTLRFADEE